jgi:hypothetical protein
MSAIRCGLRGSSSINDAGAYEGRGLRGARYRHQRRGLSVRADIDLSVGAQIGVEFTPPYSDHPMMFRCFVRNRDGNCYGVEFITESDEDYRKAGELQAGLAAMNAEVSVG